MAPGSETLNLIRYRRFNQAYVESLVEGLDLTLMLIPSGEFEMGDDASSRSSEKPQHRVSVLSFLMGRYPITQAQWRVVAALPQVERKLKEAPSRFTGDQLPVERVSWHEAQEFCQRLSRETGKSYRLPSEAEWEYACRAGTTTAYHFGDQLTPELANYQSKVGQTSKVGRYPANRWGLHDMHGNVWEWCADYWHGNYKGAPEDGSAWVEGGNAGGRVLRGGAWYLGPVNCRSAYRFWFTPDNTSYIVGFRVVCGLATD